MAKAERRGGARDRFHDPPLGVVARPRGRHVDRLLEERSIERVRLVEDRQRPEHTVVQKPLDRKLLARHERLDQGERVDSVPLQPHVRGLQDAAQPVERGHEGTWVVHADHAAAAGEGERLQHTGITCGCGELLRVVVERHRREGRRRKARGAEGGAAVELVAAGACRLGRITRKRQRLRHVRRQDRGPIADGKYPVYTAAIRWQPEPADRRRDRGARVRPDRGPGHARAVRAVRRRRPVVPHARGAGGAGRRRGARPPRRRRPRTPAAAGTRSSPSR